MQNKKADQNFTYSSFATCHVESRWQSWNYEQWQLCHVPTKAVGKESFATCQKRQSAKNHLPSANKGSRQRISVLKKNKKTFATCQ